MAVRVLYDADIIVGPYRLSPDHNQVNLTLNQEVRDVTAFGDTNRKNINGVYAIAAEGEGWYQAGATPQGVVTTLEARIGVNKASDIVTIGETKADGDEAYIFKGVQEAFSHGAAHGDPNKFKVSTKGAYRYVSGTRLLIASQVAGGNGVARQIGAASALQTIFAALHVYAFNGTTMTMKVQSDNAEGFPSSTDRITFNAATGLDAQWGELVGPVTDDWWRASWTFTGTSFAASLVVGIATT